MALYLSTPTPQILGHDRFVLHSISWVSFAVEFKYSTQKAHLLNNLSWEEINTLHLSLLKLSIKENYLH